VDRLRPEIVAVKVFVYAWSNTAKEVQITDTLAQTTANAGLPPCFPFVHDHHTDRDGHHWFSMTAIQGCTLRQFEELVIASNERLPIEFAFHVFLQLTDAMRTIFESEYVNDDIHKANIMLDPFNLVEGFPNVVLIDFGSAKPFSEARWKKGMNTHYVWNMVEDLLKLVPCRCGNTPDAGFRRSLCPHCVHGRGYGRFYEYIRRNRGLDEMRRRFDGLAREMRKGASAEAKQKAAELVVRASASNIVTDQEIVEALQRYIHPYGG